MILLSLVLQDKQSMIFLNNFIKSLPSRILEHYIIFMGIEMKEESKGLLLTQSKYITYLLQKVNMLNCKPVSTPMAISEKLSVSIGEPLTASEATNYRTVVGALQYLQLTRPDISNYVNKVCQFLHNPTKVH